MSALDFIVEEAKSGQLVILIGLDLKSDVTGLPSGSELAQKILKSPTPVADTLSQAAQRVSAPGPWTYTSVLNVNLRHKKPGPLHTLIASLPVPYLMTSTYDDGLRQALEKANRNANLLVGDDDLNERQAGRPDLIKLCGDLERDDVPLAVTSDNYDKYHSGLPQDNPRFELAKRYNAWLKEKTVLAVGCNPTSGSDFDLLYRRVLREGAFKAGAYLVWPDPVSDDKEYWGAQNVEIIADEPLAFLGALAERLKDAKIVLPPDPNQANLERIAKLLGIGAPQRQVEAVLSRLPPDQRPRQITLTFRLWLDQSNLWSLLTVQSEPDVLGGKPLLPHDTDIPFDELDEWAKSAEQTIRSSLPLDDRDNAVQQKAIEFFNKIVPPDSDEGKRYALAQSAATILKTHLTFVFEFAGQDDRVVTIPWELLHDGQVDDVGRGFLSLKYRVYRHSAYAASVEQVTGQIEKALVVSADPTTIKLAGLDQEVDKLVEILKGAGIQVEQCSHDSLDLRSPEKLKSLIRAGKYQLLHYTGHAQFLLAQPSKSKLVLSRPSREWDGGLTAEALAEVARETGLILVVLSACEGAQEFQMQEQTWQEAGLMDALTRAGVPAVLAMRWVVGSPNSRVIAETFYTHLRNGESIELALMYARQALKDLKGGQADWANPVLAKRHGVLAE
jgi:CHAT domain/SIR2-like domain